MTSTYETKAAVLGDLTVDDRGELWGRASTYDHIDSVGDVTRMGSFTATLPEFIRSGFLGDSHDWNHPIGLIVTAVELSDGLWVRGQFHSDQRSQDVRTRVTERLAAGRSIGLSIGFRVVRSHREDGVRVLDEVRLFEVSVVSVAAESLAFVQSAKDAPPGYRQLAAIRDGLIGYDEGPGLAAVRRILTANQRALAR